jgi:ElaB/YqjD/DUF883 family membrane-anchored ribosome-binding protein
MVDRMREAGTSLGERASDLASDLGARASAAGTAVRENLSAAYDAASERADRATSAMAGSAASVRHALGTGTQSFAQLCRDEPLVLAGIGVAIGAALGALLPGTETEDRLMGTQSDALKDETQSFIDRQAEKAEAVVEHVVEHVVDTAQDEAERQGLTPEGLVEEAKAAMGTTDGTARDDESASQPNEATSDEPGPARGGQ